MKNNLNDSLHKLTNLIKCEILKQIGQQIDKELDAQNLQQKNNNT